MRNRRPRTALSLRRWAAWLLVAIIIGQQIGEHMISAVRPKAQCSSPRCKR